jgi:RNase P/RNase MRP subunit POP5
MGDEVLIEIAVVVMLCLDMSANGAELSPRWYFSAFTVITEQKKEAIGTKNKSCVLRSSLSLYGDWIMATTETELSPRRCFMFVLQ